MNKFLDTVTVDSLVEFQKEAFIMYASSNGIKLGVNAKGLFVVKTRTNTSHFSNPDRAMDEFRTLVEKSKERDLTKELLDELTKD